MVLLLACGVMAGAPAHGQPPDLSLGHDALELARSVDRVGDARVLAALEADASRRDQLVAIRAAPFLRAPEAALSRLVGFARGRDPQLAPAATVALLRIARILTAHDLVAREARSEPLRQVLEDLRGLVDDESARLDLRTMADLARLEIRALFAPEHN